MSHPEQRELSHAAQGAFVILALVFATFTFLIGLYIGNNSEPEGKPPVAVATTETGGEQTEPATTEEAEEEEEEPATTAEEEEGGGAAADGKAVFASAGCGSCHTLEEAGSSGTIGPDLDSTTMSRDEIEEQVRQGGGAMPAFEGQLSDAEIEAVSDFVEASKG